MKRRPEPETAASASTSTPPRLLVVSHTPHYRRGDEIVGFGATVRELDCLASLFGQVVHLAPLHQESAPASSRPYSAPNIELRPLRPSGGSRLIDKAGILMRYPGYLRALLSEARCADMVHVRAPANVALLAILALLPGFRPWWVKYAGNWQPDGDGTTYDEPLSYALQRRLLSFGWPRLAVTVAGRWPRQPAHVFSFHNPCLSSGELAEARQRSAGKTLRRELQVEGSGDEGEKEAIGKNQAQATLRLLFVGNLDNNKGADRALRLLARLDNTISGAGASAGGGEGARAGRPMFVHLDLAGEGPERQRFEALAKDLGIAEKVAFHGSLPRPQLDLLYRDAHLLLVPSETEGWPKVIGEAMAWGTVPIASAVSCIPQILGELGVGQVCPTNDPEAFLAAIELYSMDPARWESESTLARQAADELTYDRYLDALRRLVKDRWNLETLLHP